MSLSVLRSKSSSVLVHFRKGELALGVITMFLATLASLNVVSFLLSLASSSRLKFFKEGGVMDSVRGMFSLSELSSLPHQKNLALYSFSVGLEGHGPESEVILLSFFQGVNTPGRFWGTGFLSVVGFFQGQTFQFASPCPLLKYDYWSWS